MIPLKEHIISTSLEETKQLSYKWICSYSWQPSLILLHGAIGTGKSTFVKYCLTHLQLINTQYQFNSPSYSLINEYPIVENKITLHPPFEQENLSHTISLNEVDYVYHIDLYRIQDIRELYEIDIFSEEKAVYFIEWASRIPFSFFSELQVPMTSISFTMIDETTRNVYFKNNIV